MKIYKVTDPEFRKYGRVVKNVDFTDLVARLKKTPLTRDVAYEPSVPELEAAKGVYKALQDTTYGEMPIQIGYCNGYNKTMNAMEYHRSSEINVAATDAVLLVGLRQDLEEDFSYDSSKVEAFFPAGRHGSGSVCDHSALCSLLTCRRRIPGSHRSAERHQSSAEGSTHRRRRRSSADSYKQMAGSSSGCKDRRRLQRHQR